MIVEDFQKLIWNSDYRAEFAYVKMDLKMIQQFFTSTNGQLKKVY